MQTTSVVVVHPKMYTDHTHRKCVRILRQTRDPAHRVENMVGGAQWSLRDLVSLFQPGPDRYPAWEHVVGPLIHRSTGVPLGCWEQTL